MSERQVKVTNPDGTIGAHTIWIGSNLPEQIGGPGMFVPGRAVTLRVNGGRA